ncbi:MAG: thioredoxin family protein [Bacteroidia bacterium]
MKKSLFITLLIIIVSAFQSSAQGIKFTEASFDSVKAIAKKADKLIFVDAYTSWCGPCKWMAKNIFPNDTVGKFYNSHFINFTLDMEKGEGVAFAKKYSINVYPSLLYIDASGKLVHKGIGSRDAKKFIELGAQALDPGKRLTTWQEKYDAGNRDPQFIRSYLNVLMDAGQDKDCKEITAWYFYALPEAHWITVENFELINNFVSLSERKEFQFLLKNEDKYAALVTKKKVDEKLSSVFGDSWRAAIVYHKEGGNYIPTFNEEKFNAAITGIKNSGYERSEEIIAEANMGRAETTGDWKQYVDYSARYITRYKMDDAQYLNNAAWTYYSQEKITDKDAINMAVGWARKAVELDDNYYNNDTYAAILYKSGNKKEAEKVAAKAIALADKNGQDAGATKVLLEKMKGKK